MDDQISFLILAGKSVQDGEVKNVYGVKYSGKRASTLNSEKTPEELICSASRSIKVKTFLKGDTFFKKHQYRRVCVDVGLI